jgi:hypothetical protein
MRAKFICEKVMRVDDTQDVKLSGELDMMASNPAASDFFKEGQCYYLDFTPADGEDEHSQYVKVQPEVGGEIRTGRDPEKEPCRTCLHVYAKGIPDPCTDCIAPEFEYYEPAMPEAEAVNIAVEDEGEVEPGGEFTLSDEERAELKKEFPDAEPMCESDGAEEEKWPQSKEDDEEETKEAESLD